MKWLPQFLFFLLVSFSVSAQTNPVCEDNDCSPDIFSVQLDAPMGPATAADVQRTQQFKDAYQKVRQIKSRMEQDPTWKTRYQANALNGKSCLRLNQLESYFAYEYELNPEFKKFIDQQESNAAVWKEEGFQSSRRAINLSTRMKDHCPNEVKKVEKAPAGSLDELPKKYMKLGQALGYFDEKGNQLKPLDAPATAAQPDPEDDLDSRNKKQQIAELKDQVSQLPLGSATTDKINGVKNALQNAKPNLGLLQGALGGLNAKLGTFLPKPTGLLSKINAAKDILGALKNLKLKLPFKGLFNKIGDLFKKGENLGKKVKDLVDNSNQLKDRYDDLAKKANELEDKIKDRTSAVDGLEKQLQDLKQKQKELQEKLDDRPRKILDELKQQVGDVSKKAGDLVDQVQQENDLKDKLLDELKKLTDAKDKITDELSKLEEAAADLTKEQQELDEETKAVQQEAEEAKKLDEKLEQETQEVADEIDEQAEQAEELKQEEAAIKEEYGIEVELEPVTVEEWAESFEVDRPYWDAVFHPDDEVVEGYKGRYFEVRLKDADKAVKLLFGPGEYYMSKSDFRKNYGPTIGAFVTEALHTLKKTDRDKIKVFIQGSADIVGQSTFSGNLDKSYYYEEISVLPQSGEERFAGTAVSKQVPITNFRNNDLPNLRGRYLKEMISVYSKKLDPILLEGSVKEVVSERDRNAIIYLFIPEELLEAYGN